MKPLFNKEDPRRTLYYRVRQNKTLRSAWHVIRENADASASADTKKSVADFEKDLELNLDKIQRELQKKRFVFLPAKGLALKKPGKKSKRPVVIAPVKNRVVQRSILDVIQQIPAINERLKSGHNFGGIEGSKFGVPSAIHEVYKASTQLKYFIRTDIKSFFINVNRQDAIKKITDHIDDDDFCDLIKAATETELDNLKVFSEAEKKLFPLKDIGVAQGSCLSPLLCNILLFDFDKKMNSRGIICIRYIDDFILFAKNRETAFKALGSALSMLKTYGLSAYDPQNPEEVGKAEHGFTENGFDFLGCHILPSSVFPSRNNRKSLQEKVELIFSQALAKVHLPKEAPFGDRSYAEAVRAASFTVRGWGNTYSFCTDDRIMKDIDSGLQKLFDDFNKEYRRRVRQLPALDMRRCIGFFSLQDCNKDQGEGAIRASVQAHISGKLSLP